MAYSQGYNQKSNSAAKNGTASMNSPLEFTGEELFENTYYNPKSQNLARQQSTTIIPTQIAGRRYYPSSPILVEKNKKTQTTIYTAKKSTVPNYAQPQKTETTKQQIEILIDIILTTKRYNTEREKLEELLRIVPLGQHTNYHTEIVLTYLNKRINQLTPDNLTYAYEILDSIKKEQGTESLHSTTIRQRIRQSQILSKPPAQCLKDQLDMLESRIKTFEDNLQSKLQNNKLNANGISKKYLPKRHYNLKHYSLQIGGNRYSISEQTRKDYIKIKKRILSTLKDSGVQNYDLQKNHARLYEILNMHMSTGITGTISSIFHTNSMQQAVKEKLVQDPTTPRA